MPMQASPAAVSPEISARPRRRTFTVQDKPRILTETVRPTTVPGSDWMRANSHAVGGLRRRPCRAVQPDAERKTDPTIRSLTGQG